MDITVRDMLEWVMQNFETNPLNLIIGYIVSSYAGGLVMSRNFVRAHYDKSQYCASCHRTSPSNRDVLGEGVLMLFFAPLVLPTMLVKSSLLRFWLGKDRGPKA